MTWLYITRIFSSQIRIFIFFHSCKIIYVEGARGNVNIYICILWFGYCTIHQVTVKSWTLHLPKPRAHEFCNNNTLYLTPGAYIKRPHIVVCLCVCVSCEAPKTLLHTHTHIYVRVIAQTDTHFLYSHGWKMCSARSMCKICARKNINIYAASASISDNRVI